jgi:hypothetical protein
MDSRNGIYRFDPVLTAISCKKTHVSALTSESFSVTT